MPRGAVPGFLVFSLGVAAVLAQEPQRLREKPEKFSPLGYYDLRAVREVYPAPVGDPRVTAAAQQRDWVFRGVAYRGQTAIGLTWTSLGPDTTIQNPDSGGTENVSGRVAALAISPAWRPGGCASGSGTAGGGVWRTEDAMNTTDVGWRWMGQGLGTNNIGSLAIDPNDRSGNTIYVGTGETNTPQNSGAGTGLYRSTDGGDHWTRVSTKILDTTVSPSPIDFTSTRGISTVVVEPGNPQTIYVATTSAMLGMTAVRGGQSQMTGYPQPRVGLYKTTNGGETWTLLWVPPLDPVIPPNPNSAWASATR